jgi:hypothetical protein
MHDDNLVNEANRSREGDLLAPPGGNGKRSNDDVTATFV